MPADVAPSVLQEEEPAVLRDLSKEQLQLREAFPVPGTQADWVSICEP
jgi:hypothetical protein